MGRGTRFLICLGVLALLPALAGLAFAGSRNPVLRWDAVEHAETYHVEVSRTAHFAKVWKEADVSGTSYDADWQTEFQKMRNEITAKTGPI